jgi:hypothetical protein
VAAVSLQQDECEHGVVMGDEFRRGCGCCGQLIFSQLPNGSWERVKGYFSICEDCRED